MSINCVSVIPHRLTSNRPTTRDTPWWTISAVTWCLQWQVLNDS